MHHGLIRSSTKLSAYINKLPAEYTFTGFCVAQDRVIVDVHSSIWSLCERTHVLNCLIHGCRLPLEIVLGFKQHFKIAAVVIKLSRKVSMSGISAFHSEDCASQGSFLTCQIQRG